ncbi:MAG: tRNA threonylcarbamoyladenosine dehydratase [Prevotellaceae bacterium]|jgi:tRNA A37 threonylcarbamoyladenosine dehydratase|nr:tRNA threonylcarbamoyladenosine dehydratase [Prevotellaceae bacterium]
MVASNAIFNRTTLLLGDEAMEKIAAAKVILLGVGGVGSWCAESLIRSGIRHLTMVDSDRVCITNINRQLMATTKTVGLVKVEALRQRLLDINPAAEICALQAIYDKTTAASFRLDAYDYIVDAIDSLSGKMHLIRTATRTSATFFSSMGAALKLDPTRIRVAEFWDVKGCPLAAMLRKRIRRGDLPAKKFLCVYSDEVLENKGRNTSCGTERCLCPKVANANADATSEGNPDLAAHEWCSAKAIINGTVAHTTAIFGFVLAGLVVQNICKKAEQ